MTRTYSRSWPYDPSRLSANPTEEEIAAVTADNEIYHLRLDRNALLTESDWMASGDRTMTQAQTDYRQALRDITNTYSSYLDVVWPDKPEI